ncbi:MAG: extracellular solute-binding protein [Nocardioides sp.]
MKRTLAATLSSTAAALALVLTACSGGTGSSTGGNGDASPTGPGGGDGGAGDMTGTLRVWTHQNKSFNKSYKALAEAYMAEHPDVEIQFETFVYDTYIQTLQTSLPAGTEADVLQMFGSWTCSYSSNLATVPADVMTVADAQAAYFPGPLGGYLCDDQLYGLPQESNVEYGAVLVNTDMAAAVGTSTDGWATYDDFIADAQKLTVKDGNAITRAGYHFTTNDGMAYTFLSLILQNGGSYLADDGSFTFQTPEAKASMELMKRFVDAGITDPTLFGDTTNWVGDCFFTEICAMGLVGPWVVPEYAGDFPDVAAVTKYAPLPTLDNAHFAADSGWGLTVSGASQQQALAWDFVKYVAADQANAQQWNLGTSTLPALQASIEGAARDELVSQLPYLEPFLDILDQAQYLGSLPDRDRLFYDIIVPNVLDVLQDRASVDEALAAIEQQANAI